tara:strand:- start:1834 stop:2052 length:219 start_codon:yes stop_codon:yes gene_type:complete
MKKIKLSITGMHCASCASNTERSLQKLSGVKSVSVSALTNKAFVEAEDDAPVEEMKKAISKIGYKVLDIEEE